MNQKRFLEFSKPFILAAKNIFETMVFTKIEAQKPEIKKDNTSRGDISAILGIAGRYEQDGVNKEIKGMLVLSWPETTYVKTANAMLMENFTTFNPEIKDVGAEITNMIMGNAKRDLREVGYVLDMSIPSTITGKNHQLSYPNGSVTVAIPIVSAHGDFYIELCFGPEKDA